MFILPYKFFSLYFYIYELLTLEKRLIISFFFKKLKRFLLICFSIDAHFFLIISD